MMASRPITPQEQLAKLVRDCRHRLDAAKFPVPDNAPGGPRKRQRRGPHVTIDQIATQTGYSYTWYSRLENGKIEGYSDDFLNIVAAILEMTPEETTMLFSLATRRGPARAPEEELRDSRIIQWVLDELSCPAYIIDSAWDVICSNWRMKESFPWVFCEHPNFMRWAFSPEARTVLHNWDTEWGPRLWAEMQYALARHPENAKLSALVSQILDLSPDAQRISKSPLAYVNPDGDRRRVKLPEHGGKIHAIEQVAMVLLRAPASRVVMIIELDDTQH